MPNRTPLLLLTAIAVASLAYYLYQSSKHNDEHEDDLHLTEDDGSDDVTVQVKNGMDQREKGGGIHLDDTVKVKNGRESNRMEGEVASVEVQTASVESDKPEEKLAAAEPHGKSAEQGEAPTEEPKEEANPHQEEERIQKEAQEAASKIIQSMPEIPLVDECLKEVAAAESVGDSGVIVSTGDGNESVEEVVGDVGAAVTTLHEKPEPIIESTKETQGEKSVPLKSSTSAKKPFPKTPPPSLFSPAKEEEEMEPPVDTEDYSLLKNYWKKQSDKHVFSPPTSKDASKPSIAQEAKPSSAVAETKEKSLSRSSSKEDNVASAAVAGLVVGGVINVLDHVFSSPTIEKKTFEEEEGEVPHIDESMIVEEEEEGMPSLDKRDTAETEGADTKPAAATPSKEEEKDDTSDENLILPSEGSSSPRSGSDKSSNDDYVKIVRTPSGDPITESQLLVGRPEVIDVKNEGNNEDKAEKVAEESKSESVEASTDVTAAVSETAGKASEEVSKESDTKEGTPQTKSKSKNKKKKKGKKK